MTRTLTLPMHRDTALHQALLLLLAMLASGVVFGQRKLVDQRDQAEGWYLPVHGHVLVDGKHTGGTELILYKDNKEVARTTTDKKGRFQIQLDIDQQFTLLIQKAGFETKMIHVDASLPPALVTYPDYELFANMIPVNAKNIDPFYSDFPSAIIRWNEEMGGFYHSDHYLTHIQTKLAGYASATF
jgi:hypothetical protein